LAEGGLLGVGSYRAIAAWVCDVRVGYGQLPASCVRSVVSEIEVERICGFAAQLALSAISVPHSLSQKFGHRLSLGFVIAPETSEVKAHRRSSGLFHRNSRASKILSDIDSGLILHLESEKPTSSLPP